MLTGGSKNQAVFMAQAEAATANYLMQRLYTDWV